MRTLIIIAGFALWAACRHLAPPATQGDDSLRQGAWTQAITEYDDVLSEPQALPRDAVLYRRAMALMARGRPADFAEAQVAIQNLLRTYPDGPWFALSRALDVHLKAVETAHRELASLQEHRTSLLAQLASVEDQKAVCEMALQDINKGRTQRDERLAELEDTVSEQRATLSALKESVGELKRQLDALKQIDLGAPPP